MTTRKRRRLVTVTERQCPECQEWFAPRRKDAVTCGKSVCRMRRKRRRDKQG